MSFLLSDINFMQLIIFITVAHEKSFSKAAKQLHLTQPAITKSIARLEAQLGLVLFIRTTRKFSITPEGELLYTKWEPLLQGMEDALLSAVAIHLQKNTCLKAGTTSTTNPYLYFWPIADQFKKAFPEIELIVESDSMEILLEKLTANEYDLVFLPHFERYSIEREGLRWQWAAKDRAFAYMPKEHPLAVETELRLKDLENYGLVILDEAHNPNYIRDIQELFSEAGIKPHITRTMKNAYTVKASGRDLKDIIIADAYFDFPPGTPVVRVPINGHYNGIICAYHPENPSVALKNFLKLLEPEHIVNS